MKRNTQQQLTEAERDALDSLATAIMDDPDPRSGRSYCRADGAPYAAAQRLVKLGLAFVVSGKFGRSKMVHVGPTPAGLARWDAMVRMPPGPPVIPVSEPIGTIEDIMAASLADEREARRGRRGAR